VCSAARYNGERTPAEASATSPLRFDCPPWPPLMPEVDAELADLIASGAWGQYQGETLERLRSRVASFVGVRHVRLMCSGSAAMELALRACGVAADGLSPNSAAPAAPAQQLPAEVICPALDYPGNVRAVRLLGAVPVLVDTVAGGFTIDPETVLAAATPQTVAVVASHLYGEIAAVEVLREICDRRGWMLIEDVCQMPGGTFGGRSLGSFGHAATWSFGGSKPLTAGCGGAITTDDDRIAQRLATHADRPSDAFPLSPLQAAVLIPQWAKLGELAQRQRMQLSRLTAACQKQTPCWRWPDEGSSEQLPVYYKVPLVLPSEATLRPILYAAGERGIPGGEPFRIPRQSARFRGRVDSSANASAIAARTWLLDHRVLAGDDANIDRLADVLIDLHQRSQ
jgi:dTDP-4-amino-4,6-dideoxygalactose transaminase